MIPSRSIALIGGLLASLLLSGSVPCAFASQEDPSPNAREVEAEIIAAILQQEVFGTRLSSLGYPQFVSIHGVGPRKTQDLVQEYRGIIADTWRLRSLGLGPS